MFDPAYLIAGVGGLFLIVAVTCFAIALVKANGRDEEPEEEPEDKEEEFIDDEHCNANSFPKPKRKRKPRKLRVSEGKVLDDFVELGSIKGVADRNKMAQATVKRIIEAGGMRGNPKYRNRVSRETRIEIQEALVSGEKSPRQVAREFGCALSTVRRIAKEAL